MRKISWLKEAVSGTNEFAAGGAIASSLFGFEAHGFNIPFPKRETTVTSRMSSRKPAGITIGGGRMAHDGEFDYGHAYPWVQALGGVSAAVGDVNTISIADTLPSYSFLYNLGTGQQFASYGNVCTSMQFAIEAPQPGKKPIPYKVSQSWEGLNTVKLGTDVSTAPVWPSDADEVVKGWSMSSALEFATVDDQPDVLDLLIDIQNVVDVAGSGFTSHLPSSVVPLEGTIITANVHGNYRGSVGDFMSAYLAGTSGDLVIPIDLGSDNYHEITIPDIEWQQPTIIAAKEKITTYALTGTGLDITVLAKDGHDYSTL